MTCGREGENVGYYTGQGNGWRYGRQRIHRCYTDPAELRRLLADAQRARLLLGVLVRGALQRSQHGRDLDMLTATNGRRRPAGQGAPIGAQQTASGAQISQGGSGANGKKRGNPHASGRALSMSGRTWATWGRLLTAAQGVGFTCICGA